MSVWPFLWFQLWWARQIDEDYKYQDAKCHSDGSLVLRELACILRCHLAQLNNN